VLHATTSRAHGVQGFNRYITLWPRPVANQTPAVDGGNVMPWTANDAQRHTHKASTPALQELWAKVANEALERLGDEGRAIREANAVVGRQSEER
jgi:hypothetical protein